MSGHEKPETLHLHLSPEFKQKWIATMCKTPNPTDAELCKSITENLTTDLQMGLESSDNGQVSVTKTNWNGSEVSFGTIESV